MSVRPCVCAPVCLCARVSVRPCVCATVCLFARVSVRPCVCPPVCLFARVSVRPCVCAPARLCAHPSMPQASVRSYKLCVYLAVCLFVRASVGLFARDSIHPASVSPCTRLCARTCTLCALGSVSSFCAHVRSCFRQGFLFFFH